MDKQHTAILGLEMEFEGDFHGWKALEDAHQGRAFYGYDSSVRGQNELSWDCGSYSWWKHLSPLKEVCKALRDGGAEEGPTAGIHIHVSRDDVDTNMIAEKINGWCRSGTMRTLMDAISLRTDRERYDRYANLSESAGTHHAGISRSPHRTCEFRIFASSLDEKTILLRLKFCKELFEMAVENVPKSAVMRGFSKRVKEHIIECANKQADTGFISGSDRDKLLKDLA